MKKIYLYFLATVIISASCSQKKESNVEAVVAQDTSRMAPADHTLTEIRDSANQVPIVTSEDTISAIRD